MAAVRLRAEPLATPHVAARHAFLGSRLRRLDKHLRQIQVGASVPGEDRKEHE
jgi:hypothetical protein